MERIIYALGGLVLLSGGVLTAFAPTDLMTSRDAFFARLGIIGPALISGCLIIAVGYIIQILKTIRDHLVPVKAAGSLLAPLTGAVASAGALAGKAVSSAGETVTDTAKTLGTAASDTAHTLKDTGAAAIAASGAAVIATGAAIGALASTTTDTIADHLPGQPEIEPAAEALPATEDLPVTKDLPAAEVMPQPVADAVPDLTSYLDSLLNPAGSNSTSALNLPQAEDSAARETVDASAADDFTFDLSDLTPSVGDTAQIADTATITDHIHAPVSFDSDALSKAMEEALNTPHAHAADASVEPAYNEPAYTQTLEQYPRTEEAFTLEAPVPSMATQIEDAEPAPRAPTVEEYLIRGEPAPEAAPAEPPRTVMREGQFAGRRYRMFEDGSLEIDTEQSTIKFGSLDEFRAFVSAASHKS